MCRYDVKYGSAGFDAYGYHAGCSFATGSFEEAKQDPQSARFLCNGEEHVLAVHESTGEALISSKCTFDHAGQGYCIPAENDDGFVHASTVSCSQHTHSLHLGFLTCG